MTNQCGLYGRVSTVGLGQDPKQQIDVLKSVCEQKRAGIYLENMLIIVLVQNLADQNLIILFKIVFQKINTIVCWSVDRFSRNAEHLPTANELNHRITFIFTNNK